MAGQGFLARVAGRTKQILGIQTSAGSGDAGKIPALNSLGVIDVTMLPAGVGQNIVTAPTTEALAVGAFVNLFFTAGTPNVWNARNADNSSNREAWGYVIAAVASGASATVYRLGTTNANMSGLTIGSDYYLGTVGAVITPALDPTVTGKTDQYLGRAKSATELVTEEYEPILL